MLRGTLTRNDGAFPQEKRAIHTLGQLQIVGGDQRGKPGLADEANDFPEHGIRRLVVEVPGRFVRQQDGRTVGNGARNRHALLFAAGKLGRTVGEAPAKANDFKEFNRPTRRLFP